MRQIPFANYFLFFVCKLGIKNPAESFDGQLSNAYEISYPVPAWLIAKDISILPPVCGKTL